MRRLAWIAIAAAALLAASCRTANASVDHRGRVEVPNYGLTTRIPNGWSSLRSPEQSLIFNQFLWIGNQKMHGPCTGTTDGNGGIIEQTCAFPVTGLIANRVVASWGSGGMPGQVNDVASLPGEAIRAGRTRGKLVVETPQPYSGCSGIGATEEMIVIFPVDHGRYEMDACLRGPSPTRLEAQIRTMLRATRFSTG